MGCIFISYRRSHTGGHAGRLLDNLSQWFDSQTELFFDAQHIESGQHFPQRLNQALGEASVVLVLIGPGWLEEVNRRSALPEVDFVRHEVEQSLARQQAGLPVRVIPVLLSGAGMPQARAFAAPLQATLGPLCSLDAHAFAGGKQDDWHHQFQRLRRLIAAAAQAPRERYRDRSGQPRPWGVIEHALSPHFQDPNDGLGALRRELQSGGGTAAVVGAGGANTAALHGMGGIGKTQLALAYCHRYRSAYAGIWWLRAEMGGGQQAPGAAPSGAPVANDTLLQQDALAACAAAGVAVPEGVAPSQALKTWLGSQSAPWLLVFDNADSPHLLRQHLPGPGPHHSLITSRRPDWGGLARAVELSTWTPAQGAEFLQQRLGGSTAPLPDADALAQALGGLPLALEQAASYVEATGGTVAQYLGLWQTAAAELLNRASASTGYELTVGATLSLAFKHLSPAAQQLLRLCSFAAPEPLPERFFTEHSEQLPSELAAAARQPLAWNDVVGELKRYALVQRDAIPSLDRAWLAGGQAPEGTPTELALTVHRLTQQVVRHQLAVVPEDGTALLGLLVAACPADTQHPAHWPHLAALMPHAAWVNGLSSGVALDEPTVVQQATYLLDRTASFLQFGLALLPQARGLFEQVLAVHRRVHGQDHPDTLTSMNNLANTLQAQGDLSGARNLHEQDLAVCCRVLGEDHPDTLTSMSNLASTLRAQGDLTGARSLQERLMAICRRVLSEDHPIALAAMNNLAHTLWSLGDMVDARRLLEQVLLVYRRVQGDEHPGTLTLMNNLAETLRAQGDLAGACSFQEQVLDVCRRVQGEEHPNTLISKGNLAMTLWAQGDLASARSLEEQVLDVHLRVMGDQHPDALNSMNNLAFTYWNLGQRDKAIGLMSLAVQGRAAKLGAEHPDTQASADLLLRMRSGGI